MQIIEPYVEVWPFDAEQICKNIEKAGRVAYKSENKITENSYAGFIQNIIRLGHESVLEHEKLTVTFVVDRGVSHEIVRHRIASFTQESTRYCNYSGEKFGNEITVIRPFWVKNSREKNGSFNWFNACETSEHHYLLLLERGWTPQYARSVLPNSLKTEIVMTANIREWRHFFRLRCAKNAHPQMRQVAIPLLLYFQEKLPLLFRDINYDQAFESVYFANIVC